jgi:hypothetical protein
MASLSTKVSHGKQRCDDQWLSMHSHIVSHFCLRRKSLFALLKLLIYILVFVSPPLESTA